MANALIERAGRALARWEAARRGFGNNTDKLYENFGEVYRTDARAALLAALEDGDEAMEHAVAQAMSRPPREGDIWDDGDPYSITLAKKAIGALRELCRASHCPPETNEVKP
jgi:hypothetical protein